MRFRPPVFSFGLLAEPLVKTLARRIEGLESSGRVHFAQDRRDDVFVTRGCFPHCYRESGCARSYSLIVDVRAIN